MQTGLINDPNTCFIPVPVYPGSPDNEDFHLHTCAQYLPLVTPITLPPFKFYIQSRFPDEPPAIFHLSPYILNISEIYDGKRSNLKKTLDLIRDMDPLVMDSAYAELGSLMLSFGHFIGKDVFQLGKYIMDDTGVDSLAFQSLPQTVQSMIVGVWMKLIYSHMDIENATMKSYRTYDINPGYILPYTFTGTTIGDRWAITYGINEQLGHTAAALSAPVSNTKNYQFQLHLKADLKTIEIHSDRRSTGEYFPLESKRYTSGSLGYYFVNEGKFVNTPFNVLPYALYITEMYGGLRENIIKTADFIQNNSTDLDVDKALAYEQLLSEMTENGHIEGREIFEVGQYIIEDLGNSSPTFRLLPPTVQLILNGETIRLSLEKNGEKYPMKYSWASDRHENIHAFGH